LILLWGRARENVPGFAFHIDILRIFEMSLSGLSELEQRFGYTFRDITLLERAITHRSWAFENLTDVDEETIRERENESLEFVGDSVVGLIVAEQLFRRYPKLDEGDLTLMKHHLVSGSALASVAEELDLGKYLRLGGSEAKSGRGKQSLLTNAFEAVVGAVFLDGGYIATRSVLVRLLDERLRSVTPQTSVDFKSRLQNVLQAQKQRTATYRLLRSEGPPHKRTFYVEVEWENGTADGEGNTIKAAEMAAAEKALTMLQESEPAISGAAPAK
jgi:ribonuclease III